MSAVSSQVTGDTSRPLSAITVASCLREAVADVPNRLALVVPHQSVRWSYQALAEQVDRFAAGLAGLDLEPGARVGIWAPNCAEWVVAQFATARAGLVLVNLNPAYRADELVQTLVQVGCAALIVAPRVKSSDQMALLEALCPNLPEVPSGAPVCPPIPTLRWLILIDRKQRAGFLRYEDMCAGVSESDRVRLDRVSADIAPDAPVNIQFTSGTTGRPKAATLTHHNIVNNAGLASQRMALTERDCLCIPVPLHHCFGMVLGTLCAVRVGAALVLPSPTFDPQAVLESVAAERCTVLHGVPTMFLAELELPSFESYDLRSLRTGIMAGAPCPAELMTRVMERMHLTEITVAYGMTETGPLSFQTDVHDSTDRRVHTVGRVLPHTYAKVVDEQGNVVPCGAPGQLKTRGYCVMRGYWNDPPATAAAIDGDGWLATGDLATLDADGYCRIVGRLKDMVIRGGENIYPTEIEDLIYGHPAVEQVEVIGVPDARLGEELCAWVKLRHDAAATPEEIREHCRSRAAHFKVPRHVRLVEAFPLTATGKVKKHAMREQMARELASGARTGNRARGGTTMSTTDIWQYVDDLGPEQILHLHDAATGLRAIVVVDNTACGPAIGGTRMGPEVTLAECLRLARSMTLKNAAAGLPHGGGKSVIVADPKMPPPEKERLLRAFAQSLRDLRAYTPGPDMGTDETCMAWVRDEIGRAVGLPPELGGIPLDAIGATGFGLGVCAEVAQAFCDLSLDGARVIVQGFGSVGRHAARFLRDRGAKVVAVADTTGIVHDPAGLDVDALVAHKLRGEGVMHFGDGEKRPLEALLDVPGDLLVPAARPDVIRIDDVERVRVRLVLPGANIAVTADAERALHARGVLVVPDFIANAGGVICAAVELRNGTAQEAFAAIEEKVRANTERVLAEAAHDGRPPRALAVALAERRVRTAMAYRR